MRTTAPSNRPTDDIRRFYQRARLDDALSAAQSVQVELPGPFSDREVSAYVDGQISAAELYRRTVARYRQV